MVKVPYGIIIKILNNIQVANNIPFGIFGPFEQNRQELPGHPERGRPACSPFLGYYTTFGINFFFGKQEVIGPVVEYHKAGINKSGVFNRHITDIINRFIECRKGIDITTKGHSVFFQCADYAILFTGKISCAVKGHVFKEVGKSVLVIVFEQGAYILNNVKACPVLRFIVLPDIISQAVVESSPANFRVDGYSFTAVLSCACNTDR